MTSTTTANTANDIPDVPKCMVHNQFFDEFTEKVRTKPIPWEGYCRAGLISQEELDQLKHFQQLKDKNTRDLSSHIGLLIELVDKLSSIDALQYLLVMLDDIVQSTSVSVNETLFRCTDKKDDFLGLKASKIMVAMADKNYDYARLFKYLEQCMQSERASVVDVAVQVMQSALRVTRARYVLYDESTGCLNRLVDVLKRATSGNGGVRGVVAVPQTQYEVVFCLWLLSFETKIARSLDKRYEVVPVMVEIARSTVKEKVIRIIISTWTNMLTLATSSNSVVVAGMLAAKVPACLHTLSSGRSFKDEDLKQSIQALNEQMLEHAGVMTTWDEYLNEVASGRLEWSPAHRSEQFWKLHVKKMDENNHRVVRQLAHVLESQTASETALAVTCHDLSQYVKLNPDGKRLLARIGAKSRIMSLMTDSENPEVKYEALMCVQQIMLNAWRN